MAPLRLPGIDGGITAARAALERLVLEMPRTELLVGEEEYLRFVCTSLVWRFRDDLEFHVVPEEMVIHVRSASRVGYSDLGANRARVKRFRRVWGDWLARHGSGR